MHPPWLQGRKSADSKESETLPHQEQAACDPSTLARPSAQHAQSLSRVSRDAQVARLRQEVSSRLPYRAGMSWVAMFCMQSLQLLGWWNGLLNSCLILPV